MSNHHRCPIFSFWAWLILAPPLITVWGGYSNALFPGERLGGLVAATALHVLLGGCFWLADLVERRLGGAARWVWFGAVVITLSFLRPFLADQLWHWLGLDLDPPAFALRAGLNVLGLSVVLLIVYFALARVQQAADRRRRIAAVLARTEQQRGETEVQHAALILEYQRTIADPIRHAIAGVDPDRPARQIAARLMRVVNEVVRPLTNQTFAMGADATEYQYRPPDGEDAEPEQPRLGTPQRVEATTPWGPVGVWLALQLPIVLVAPEPALGLGLVLASTSIVLLCTWLVGLHPLPRSSPLAIALLALEYAVIGAIGTLVLVLPDPATTTAGNWVYGVLLYAVVGTSLSLGRSSMLDYLASERQLGTELLEARYRANAAHAVLAETTNLLARRLHAAIQADVVAAALQLRLGTPDPAGVVTELRARVERVLAAPMLPSSVDAEHDRGRPFAEGIRAATRAGDEAWREALDLRTEYDEELWQWLTEHPWQRAFIREVCTQALTNVVRYSRGHQATLSIRIDGGRLRIEVRHPGRILPRDQRISRLAEFASRAELAEVVQEDGDVVYRVIA